MNLKNRILIKEVFEGKKNKVEIAGWVHNTRELGKIKFLLLRDVSGLIQVTAVKGKVREDIFKIIDKIPRESVVYVKGIVKDSKQAPGGKEIVPEEIEIISKAEDLPIDVSEHSKTELPKRLDYRWLDLRRSRNLMIFKIWTYMEKVMREWWNTKGFIQIYSPKFMPSPSESGAELFELEYFGKKAYLSQSPQFYKQMAMAAGFERIFEIGPVFRANPSHTTRHDTEFTMIDMEVSFIDSHENVMKLEEEWLSYILKKIKEKYGNEIKNTFGVEVVVPKLPFPRLTMKEAQKLLKKEGYKGSKDDLDLEGEKLLSKIVKKKFNHDFIFVTEYPWSIRPFYHMKKEDDKNLTKSFDLIWKGTEITTGAQREHRHDILKKQAKDKNISLNLIKDYLNFFKYGCPSHGGFGLSPTRMLMLLLNIKNVREVTFLPRDTDRLTP